jgi:hypothetical protein
MNRKLLSVLHPRKKEKAEQSFNCIGYEFKPRHLSINKKAIRAVWEFKFRCVASFTIEVRVV